MDLCQRPPKTVSFRTEVDECLAEQASHHATGDFFQVWLFVVVSATV
jgi:hypothetical protein